MSTSGPCEAEKRRRSRERSSHYRLSLVLTPIVGLYALFAVGPVAVAS